MERLIYRQGDVLIMRIEKLPDLSGMVPVREGGQVVLAHGEVTGHHHAIKSKSATLYRVKGGGVPGGRRGNVARNIAGAAIAEAQAGALIADAILQVKAPVVLRHQEHAPVKLPPGNYVVRIQREYAPGELRNVAD